MRSLPRCIHNCDHYIHRYLAFLADITGSWPQRLCNFSMHDNRMLHIVWCPWSCPHRTAVLFRHAHYFCGDKRSCRAATNSVSQEPILSTITPTQGLERPFTVRQLWLETILAGWSWQEDNCILAKPWPVYSRIKIEHSTICFSMSLMMSSRCCNLFGTDLMTSTKEQTSSMVATRLTRSLSLLT
jgi:hypothetical protein